MAEQKLVDLEQLVQPSDATSERFGGEVGGLCRDCRKNPPRELFSVCQKCFDKRMMRLANSRGLAF